MLQQLYSFFNSILTNGISSNAINVFLNSTSVSVFGQTLTFGQYFALICSFVSLIFIVVLCCLFVYKIIKLIGGLIR